MTGLLALLRDLRLDGMHECLLGMTGVGDHALEPLMPLLLRLLEAEAEYRRLAKAHRLTTRARFRYEASLGTVVASTARNLDPATIHRLGDGLWIRQGRSLLLCGPTGAGKSYLATALGRQACLQGFSTRYEACPKLWPRLAHARAQGCYQLELRTLSKIDLLILDDFGLAPLDVTDRLSLLEIMEDRWGKAATILVSQRPVASWYDTLGEPTVADAICDRLFSNSETIELKGDSLRRFPPKLDPNLPPAYVSQLRARNLRTNQVAAFNRNTHSSSSAFLLLR